MKKNYPECLFISNKNDFTCDYLIEKFKKTDIPYLRLNSEDINKIEIFYEDSFFIELKYNNLTYDLSKVYSVFYRRLPSVFDDNEIIEKNDFTFILRERKEFFEGIYLNINAKWINSYRDTYFAERKIFQLKVANELNFHIPKFLISNTSRIIREFITKYSPCIIKPISNGLISTHDGFYSIYTNEIKLDHVDTNTLYNSPVLIQEKILNKCDIRVTVVGKQIFAVEITKENDCVDWRRPEIHKQYKLHSLPIDLEAKILRLMEKLNLYYSAIDFILTPDGEYIFLEINPVGEWIWLEKILNLPISDIIIKGLQNGMAR